MKNDLGMETKRPRSPEANSSTLVSKLGTFIQFEQDIRDAETMQALGFVVCNQIRSLLNIQTCVWARLSSGQQQRVFSIAGVSSFDPEAPLVRFTESLIARHLQTKSDSVDETNTTEQLDRNSIPSDLAHSLDELGLPNLIYCELPKKQGTLILLRDSPWKVQEQQLLHQLSGVISHAANALEKRHSLTPQFWRNLPRYKMLWVGLILVLVGFIPVPQSVIAEGEIIASNPSVITAAQDGIVKELPVQPNEKVKAGQLLVRFDSSALDHKLARITQEKAVAVEKLRKTQQATLARSDQGQHLVKLQADVDLKSLEIDYLAQQIQRTELRAETDGIALYTRPKDWLGRTVQTGEKIMEVAVDNTHQFEAWVAVNDAIELKNGNEVRFFPDAFPLNDLQGSISSVSYYARRSTNDQQLAYRVVADVVEHDPIARLGMKGAVRLYGEKVALGYYLFRAPISAIRQTLGI